jgi:hypothetical protein
MTHETAEEFIVSYCAYHKTTRENFDKYKVALPCDCEEGGGPTHWAAILNQPHFIADHNEFHNPLTRGKEEA